MSAQRHHQRHHQNVQSSTASNSKTQVKEKQRRLSSSLTNSLHTLSSKNATLEHQISETSRQLLQQRKNNENLHKNMKDILMKKEVISQELQKKSNELEIVEEGIERVENNVHTTLASQRQLEIQLQKAQKFKEDTEAQTSQYKNELLNTTKLLEDLTMSHNEDIEKFKTKEADATKNNEAVIAELYTKVENSQKAMEETQSQVLSLQEKLSCVEAEDERSVEVNELKAKLCSAKTQHQQFKEESETAAKTLEKALAVAENKNEKSQGTNRDLENKLSATVELKDQTLAACQQSLDGVKAELLEATEKNESLTTCVDGVKAELLEATEKTDGLTALADGVKAELLEATEIIESLTTCADGVKAELLEATEKNESLTKLADGLKAELLEGTEKVESLTTLADGFKAELLEATEKNESLTSELEEKLSLLSEMEGLDTSNKIKNEQATGKLEKKLQTEKKKYETATSKLREAKSELAAQKKELKKLKSDSKSATAVATEELETSKSEKESTEMKLTETEKELDSLRRTYEAFQAALKEDKDIESCQVVDLKSQLDNVTDNATKATEKLTETEKELDILKKAHKSLQAKLKGDKEIESCQVVDLKSQLDNALKASEKVKQESDAVVAKAVAGNIQKNHEAHVRAQEDKKRELDALTNDYEKKLSTLQLQIDLESIPSTSTRLGKSKVPTGSSKMGTPVQASSPKSPQRLPVADQTQADSHKTPKTKTQVWKKSSGRSRKSVTPKSRDVLQSVNEFSPSPGAEVKRKVAFTKESTPVVARKKRVKSTFFPGKSPRSKPTREAETSPKKRNASFDDMAELSDGPSKSSKKKLTQRSNSRSKIGAKRNTDSALAKAKQRKPVFAVEYDALFGFSSDMSEA